MLSLNEFTKLAINLRLARKAVSKAVKPLLIRKKMLYSHMLPNEALAALEDMAPGIGKTSIGPMAIHPRTNKMLGDAGEAPPNFGRKAHIFAKGKIRDVPIAKEIMPVVKGKNAEMLNRIILLHEHNEIKNAKKIKNLDFFHAGKHVDPNVLLAEHNAVASLPKRYSPARRAMVALRNSGIEGVQFGMAGLEYGKKRLSPAAKKFFADKMRNPQKYL